MLKNIKYCHLNFVVEITQDSILPRDKTCMLVGAMVSHFRILYCIYNDGCTSCKNSDFCIIQNMMGDDFDIKKPIAMQHELQPKFVIQCLDKRNKFKEGDILQFEIILFGNLVALFSQYIYVFDTLGHSGIGPNRVKYQLLYVNDMYGNLVYKDGYLLRDVSTSCIYEYVESKLKCNDLNKMSFKSPCSLYVSSKNRYFINNKVLSYCLKRRLKAINILETNDEIALNKLSHDMNIISNMHIDIFKQKYNLKKKNRYIIIAAYKGYICFNYGLKPYLKYFLVCEKFCIGQNLMMGFGQYAMEG